MAKMTPAEAMTAMLEALAPHQRPFGYGRLLDAAQALTPASAAQASAILGILGTSQFAASPRRRRSASRSASRVTTGSTSRTATSGTGSAPT